MREAGRVARFVLVGGLNTAIDTGAFLLLAPVLPAAVAQAIAYLLGSTNSFLWNRLWTFRSASTRPGGALVRFIFVNFVALVVGSLLAAVMVDVAEIGTLPTKAIVVLTTFSLNYILYRTWVFAEEASAP